MLLPCNLAPCNDVTLLVLGNSLTPCRPPLSSEQLTMNCRTFLATTGTVSASLALGAESPKTNASGGHKPQLKLGLCTYSYWHFRDPKISIETVVDKAAELGVDGIDVLHRQMDIPEREPLTDSHRAYLQKLKRQAFRKGVSFVCLSTHQT